MELSVYSGEVHTRSKRRRIVFSIILLLLFVVTLFWPLIAQWWEGTIFTIGNLGNFFMLTVLIGWYFWWMKHHGTELITLRVFDWWLYVWKKLHMWNLVEWFVVEAERDTGVLKNIVIVFWNTHEIHTIHEKNEDTIVLFIEKFKEYVPRLSWFQQSSFEMIIRRSKI